MKKQQVDHILRAAGETTGETQFIIISGPCLDPHDLAIAK